MSEPLREERRSGPREPSRHSCDAGAQQACGQTLRAIFELIHEVRENQKSISARLEPMEQAWRDVQGAKRSMIWAAGGISVVGALVVAMFKALVWLKQHA